MSNLLGPSRGLAYVGTSADSPVNAFYNWRDPLPSDNLNYSILDLWVNSTNNSVWMLVSLQGNAQSKGQIGNWQQIMFDNAIIMPEAIELPATNNPLTQGFVSINGIVILQAYGTRNLFLGASGNTTLTVANATDNLGLGSNGLMNLSTGSRNLAIGSSVLSQITTTNNNVAIGYRSQINYQGGGAANNTSLGALSLGNAGAPTGNNNIAVGFQAGINYSGGETNNICIGHQGVAFDLGVQRLGTDGTQTETFIAGDVNVAHSLTVADDSGVTVAGLVKFTNATNTAANGGGVFTIAFKSANPATSTGFLKIYVGGVAYYIPFFANPAP